MALKCSACTSLNRATIDADLARGCSTRVIAQRFGISKSAIQRHGAKCMGAALAAAAQAGAVQRGSALANQLADLVRDAKAIQAEALSAKDGRLGVMAIRELVRIAELTARISGDLASHHHVTVTVQPTMSESEALELSRDCLLALATPDQQRQLAAELLARAGEDQDQLLIEGDTLGAAPNAPSQTIEGE